LPDKQPEKFLTPERKTELTMINEIDMAEPEPPIAQEGLLDETNMSRVHPIPNYSDTENMWVKLCNVEKPHPVDNKYQNDLSLTTV
jgi:hypothetical protein